MTFIFSFNDSKELEFIIKELSEEHGIAMLLLLLKLNSNADQFPPRYINYKYHIHVYHFTFVWKQMVLHSYYITKKIQCDTQ